MIPLRDVIPTRTTAWVTLLLILVNGLVFAAEMAMPAERLQAWLSLYGLVPAQFSWLNVATSLFAHDSGWLLGANVVALWIFGENVEDRMGHARFLLFYLLAGSVAAGLQIAATPDSVIPMVGASGAIAGVMGAYLVLFPRSRILVLFAPLVLIDIVEVPAVFFLGLWFLMQVLSGLVPVLPGTTAGLGLWAHLGGFLTGLGAVFLFRQRHRLRVEWWDLASR